MDATVTRKADFPKQLEANMVTPKEGCSVQLGIMGTDENGEAISDLSCRWYGYPRAEANEFQLEMLDALMAVMHEKNATLHPEDVAKIEEVRAQFKAKKATR